MKANSTNILKRAAAAVLCAAFLLPGLLPTAAYAQETAEGIQSEAERTLARIQLSVGEGQETPVFQAGEKAKLQVSVKNTGNTDAQHVRIAPVIKEESEWPFELDQMNYEQDLGTVEAGGQTDAVWGGGDSLLTVKNSVTGKAYKLNFHITYDDGEKVYETEKYVFVKTGARTDPSGETSSGGGSSAKPPSGETSSGGGSSAKSPSGEEAGGMTAGSVYNSEPVASGRSGAGSSSVPRVIVTGFSTEPGDVRAGSNFKLVVHLKNTSSQTAVSNMLFDFQAPSSGTEAAAEAPAFLPASGSSSVYLDSIPAGSTKDIAIDLNARADLVQKPYSISLNMKYEDSGAAQYEAQSSLAIPVRQEARFEFSKIQIAPDTVSVGEEANITCSLYNLGRVKMYNVKARFEGKMIDSQEQFIGNLEAGATGTIDAIVTAKKKTKDGEECRLILTYEDDAGNVSTAEQKFKMTVTEENAGGDMKMVSADEPEEGHSPLGAVAAVLAVGAAAVVSAVLIKRRKNKIRQSEEEEMFDEVERLTEDEH